MPAPKKPDKLERWIKDARKKIPEIPALDDTGWKPADLIVTPEYIYLKYAQQGSNDTCSLRIDRTIPSF